MENAAEALKMAAFVLIFAVTLATAIVSFSNVRVTAQTILDYTDREYDYTYVDDQNGQTARIVSAETMVPAIMRAYKENYKIFFYENESETPMIIYEKTLSNSTKDIRGIYTYEKSNSYYFCNFRNDNWLRSW